MKITKTEKIWLGTVLLFYVLYNLPFVPAYGHAKATLIHSAITLIPLWISIYVGLVKVCRIYRLRKPQTEPTKEKEEKSFSSRTNGLHSLEEETC